MKKMPAHLPPLPDGAVYLGRGGEFSVPGGRMGGWACSDTPPREWLHQGHAWKGNGISNHYAAPADSEIARLNGCGKPSWESAPEWAEWLAQEQSGGWVWFESKPRIGPIDDGIEDWVLGRLRGMYEDAGEGPPNPNWQDTLERRPRGCLYASLDEANSEIIRIGQNMRRVLRALDVAVEGRGTKTGDAEESSKRVAEAVSMEQPTFTHVTVRDGGVQLHQSPDLVIPKDVAAQIEAYSYMHDLAGLGYRIEIDSEGIRGWRE